MSLQRRAILLEINAIESSAFFTSFKIARKDFYLICFCDNFLHIDVVVENFNFFQRFEKLAEIGHFLFVHEMWSYFLGEAEG
jgi:hypothetical protein